MTDDQRPKVDTITLHLSLEQHDHSWELQLISRETGVIGVGAFGPIESLPVILGILERAGIKVNRKGGKPPALTVVKNGIS